MAYTTQSIRNIALAGPAGGGKTWLMEELLLNAGAIRAKGNLQRGTTVSELDSCALRLQHSLDPKVVSIDVADTHLNLIDTPGYPDFFGRTLAMLEAVESVAIVVSAQNGVDSVTQKLMDLARERGLCRLLVVNKIDSRDAHGAQLLEQLRERFGPEVLPINLPARGGAAVLDCFWQPDGARPDFGSVEQAHTRILEQVIELDEELMAQYLDSGASLTPAQLHAPFEKALREGHLVPVAFVSAETGAGVADLLQIMEQLMPSPAEGNPPLYVRGTGEGAERVAVKPDAHGHLLAHAFKISIDPYVGKVSCLRVHQGTLRPGQSLFVDDGRKPVRISHLFRLAPQELVEVPEAIAGDLCAVSKIEELHRYAVLHDCHEEDACHLKSIASPPAMLGLAIEPGHRGEEQRLADALHKLTAEDPCVRIEHAGELKETVLYGTGELHLRVLLERMSERYGVQVKTHPPSIPYRETATRLAEGHCRHKKQTGGAGQFGEVFLRIEPLPRGGGFEFVDEVAGGAIPGQFIPAVEKGVRQALREGALAGFPVEDVRVVVHDGKSHPVDSKEVAFVAAGRKAFLDAFAKAGPIVLEPIMRLEIEGPADTVGDITGDLSARRARIHGNSSLPGQRAQLRAWVPLAELHEYASRLKGLTGGQGSYTMELDHYDPVPVRRQQELAESWRPRAEEA
jgi:elongation factor G